jgi:hypothetical protein
MLFNHAIYLAFLSDEVRRRPAVSSGVAYTVAYMAASMVGRIEGSSRFSSGKIMSLHSWRTSDHCVEAKRWSAYGKNHGIKVQVAHSTAINPLRSRVTTGGPPGSRSGHLGIKRDKQLAVRCGVALVEDVVELLKIVLLLVGMVCLNYAGVWDGRGMPHQMASLGVPNTLCGESAIHPRLRLEL